MLYNGEVRQTMEKPARGGQGLSNNGDAQGWTEEPQNRGSAETIIPQAPRTGLPPWGCVCVPQFELLPKVTELLGEMQGFSQGFSLSPTREQGAGEGRGGSATAHSPWSRRDLPQLFPFPKENRGCPKRWDHPRGEGRKKPFSRALPPGNWESDAAGGGRARAPGGPCGCQHKPLS